MEASPRCTCSCTYRLLLPPHVPVPHRVGQIFTKSTAATMLNDESSRGRSGSHNGDRKRKHDDRGARRGGRGGRPMQHGSRPNKKRNMGRKEHK